MYEKINIKRNQNKNKNTLNIGLIIFVLLIFAFVFRIFKVINNTKERGGFFYVEILNKSLPVVEDMAYDEEDYAENNLSIKTVCLKALGLYNISSLDIVSDEVCYYDGAKDELKSQKIVSAVNPYEIGDNSIVKSDKNTLVDTSLVKTLNNAVPEVLIYHTHNFEAYEGSVDSQDTGKSVIEVGEELKKSLEAYGISAIHDTTNHCTTYNGCYNRSNETVRKYLKQYGDFKLIIDLHRDSTENKNASALAVNGVSTAKIMLVTAKNSSRYEKNRAAAEFITNKTNELFPGMAKDIYTYNSGILSFNQNLSDNSVLIEFGTYVNTIDEVDNSAKCMARVIAEYINGKK